MMRGKNRALLSIMLGALFFFSFALVSAAPTLVSPASSDVLSGTSVLNVTNGTLIEMLNCSWYASSPSTANSSASLIAEQTNESASATNINVTFDSSILEDSDDYTIYAVCFNETDNETTASSTSVVIDNTVPTAPSAVSPADYYSLTSSGTQDFSATVDDASTTECTYTIYRGGSSSDGYSGSGTYSTNTCSFSQAFSSSADNGDWWVTYTASDGTNTTSTTSHLTVSIPAAGGGSSGSSTTYGDTVSESGKGWIFGVALIIVLAVLAFILLKREK